MTARLPPYSTFRTDKTQVMVPQAVSHGNILTFTPKGFKQTLNVKFPDSRLAVCEKCKKNYKTRDSCRVRSGHTTVPWTTAYICITLDDSCTDSAGKYVDKPLTVRMINWQPYCVKELFDDKTPVCAACKKTNRTKSFCRIRHKHRQMPWCTVFVILSTVESTDPSTVVAAPSVPAEFMLSCPNFNDHCTTDNIEAIESSRTFLAKISATESSIHWLRYNNAEGNNSGATESDVKALNDAIRTLGAGAPPPVLDANQQYYQMTQQVIQQQAYMQQPSYGWPYPPSMMPMTVAPSAPSVPQTTEITGTSWGASNGGSGGKESGKDDAKDYKDKGGENTVDAYQQVNGQSTADAYQQQQAWQAQMMYQNQLYHNQMYATQQQQFLASQQKSHDNGQEFSQQDIGTGNSKQSYSQQDSTAPFTVPIPLTLPVTMSRDNPQQEAYSLPQESMNQAHQETPEVFPEAQDIQGVINDIVEPGMKIEDEDLSQSISPNFFSNSFSSPSEIPKRGREMENPQFSREVFDGQHESKKRARVDEEHNTSI